MAQFLVISCFLAIYAHDVLDASLLEPSWLGAACFFAGLAILVGVVFWAGARAARRLDVGGNLEAATGADWTGAATRVAIAAWHVVGVMVLGWAGLVRSYTGDLLLVDELLIILPAMAAMSLTWAAVYPVDRRIHEAILVRYLDAGEPFAPPLTRAQFTFSKVRHNLLLALLPLSLLMGWSECVEHGAKMAVHAARDAARGGPDTLLAQLGARENLLAYVIPLTQLVGVAIIMSAVPVIMRRVWDTKPLDRGPLRDGILAACRRWNVRVRELLVWRTHGTMVNGAVLGFIAPLRYILLTDRLLETMTWPHIEAVTAHEIAHVKLRHLPWLVASILAAMAVGGVASELLLRDVMGFDLEQGGGAVAAIVMSLSLVVLVIGPVSRVFERQADAFAAKHLSATVAPNAAPAAGDPGGVDVVTPEGAETMVGALQAVANLNGIPVHRWSFRHGSIADRQQHLRALAGQPTKGLRIDRAARRVKRAAALTLAALVVIAVVAELL